MDKAIRLNNEGVTQLLAGNDEQSIILFQNSIIALKQVTTISSSSSSASSNALGCCSNCNNNNNNDMTTIDRMILFQPIPYLKKEKKQQQLEGFLYSNAILIRPWNHHHNHHRIDDNTFRFYCACVILNLALTYHCTIKNNRYSINDCNITTTIKYQRAERLYDNVLKLIASSSLSNHNNNNNNNNNTNNNVTTIGIILKIGAANNVSLLRFEYGINDYDQAKKNLTIVATIIDSLQNSKISNSMLQINATTTTTAAAAATNDMTLLFLLDEDEIDGYRSNIILLFSYCGIVSAPAA